MAPDIKSLYVNQERAERDVYKEKMKKWKRDEVLREIECTELCSPAEVKNAFQADEEGDEEECDDAHVNILLKTLSKVETSSTSRDLLEISVKKNNETNQTQTCHNAEKQDKSHDLQEMLSCIKEDLIEPAFQTNLGFGTNLTAPTNNTFSPIRADTEYGFVQKNQVANTFSPIRADTECNFVQKNQVARHNLNFRTINNPIFTPYFLPHGNDKYQPPSVDKVNDDTIQSFGTSGSGGVDAIMKYYFSTC